MRMRHCEPQRGVAIRTPAGTANPEPATSTARCGHRALRAGVSISSAPPVIRQAPFLLEYKNRFLLADTNALLHNIVREGDPSFVFEKIGSNIRHVMIDEFQDTSRMQWDNFKLLLLEGLAQGADSLIVGDVKQSIYRWRNGDWNILNNLKKKIEAFKVEEKTLDTNRRSKARIVKFNNDFFTAACEGLNEKYREEQNKDCEELKQAYQDVVQKTTDREEKGSVKVTLLSKKEETGYEEDTLQQLAQEVESLMEQGETLNNLAILIRYNRMIPLIADYFDKHTPYRIVSDEAFRLDASLAICMMLDALRYLNDPDNRIAKAQLAAAYQNEVLKKGLDLNSLLLHDLETYLPTEFVEQTDTLRLMPLYELLEKLFNLFQLSLIEEQDAYLFSFFDKVNEYLKDHSSELTAFIHHWEENLCSKTIPSGEIEGIRILSIHKSKGLEFPVVFLCGMEENTMPISRAVDNDEDMEEERRLMYVAITRAKERLYLTRSKSRYLYGKREPTARSRFLKELASEIELPKALAETARQWSKDGVKNAYVQHPEK